MCLFYKNNFKIFILKSIQLYNNTITKNERYSNINLPANFVKKVKYKKIGFKSCDIIL